MTVEFQKWSWHGVLSFWLRHVLRATTLNFQKWSEQCVFFTFCLRNVLRAFAPQRRAGAHFFDISTSKSADVRCLLLSHFKMCFAHSSAQFLISHPARWLRTRRFLRAYFSTLRSPNNIGCFATFLPLCARWSSFFFLSLFWSFFSDPPLTLPTSVCCTCPYCRKFDF